MPCCICKIPTPDRQAPRVAVDAAFYGTLNLQTHQEIVTRSPGLNAQVTAQHLQAILDAIPDRPTLLVWDRAPWHHGQPIRDLLTANPRLQILYFPVASPESNPQEHVWKASRCAVSHNHCRATLPELTNPFQAHLNTHTFPSSFLDRYAFNTICRICN
jgi:hypothetical protein